MAKKLTVVYDDGCPACTVGKNFSEKLDQEKSMEFVGMNSEQGRALIRQHDLDMNASAYAFREDGSKTARSRMMRDVLARNGWLGFLFSLPFRIPLLGDKLYDVLARHRRHTTKSAL